VARRYVYDQETSTLGGYSPARGLQNTNPQWAVAPVEKKTNTNNGSKLGKKTDIISYIQRCNLNSNNKFEFGEAVFILM